MPPRAKHHLQKIRNKSQHKSSKKSTLSQIYNKTTFKVFNVGNSILLKNPGVLLATVDLCPKFEIPNPVKLGPRKSNQNSNGEDLVHKAVEKVAQQGKVNLNPILKLSPLKKSQTQKVEKNLVKSIEVTEKENNSTKPLVPTETKTNQSPLKQVLAKSPSKKKQAEILKKICQNIDDQKKMDVVDEITEKNELKQKSILNYFTSSSNAMK